MKRVIPRRQFLKGSALGAGIALGAKRSDASLPGGPAARLDSGRDSVFEDTVVIPLNPNHTHRGYSGSIIRLRDGSLLFACGNPSNEIQQSGIIGRISKDSGRTWGDPFSMQRNFARKETVAPSLLRVERSLSGINSGDLLFGYNVLNNWQGTDHRLYDGHFYVRRSTNEGISWEDQFCATLYPGFHTVQPQRLLQLSSGRIVAPAEWSKTVGGGEAGHMVCLAYYTDDGYTWVRSKNFVDTGKTTEEPVVVELRDHRLLLVFRNVKGYVGRAYSRDGGDSWTDVGFYKLPSPLAPQYIARIPKTGDLLLLWLDNQHAPGLARGEKQPRVKVGQLELPLGTVRAPLASAISSDEGLSWEHIRNITTDPKGDYGYQSVTFVDDVALVNYNALDGIHVTRIGVDWFYEK